MDRLAKIARQIGIGLLLIAIVRFVFHVPFFGVSNLLLEGAGLALISFSYGLGGYWIPFVMLLALAVVAAFLDPNLWNAMGYHASSPQKFSWMINGVLAAVMLFGYLVGTATRRKKAGTP